MTREVAINLVKQVLPCLNIDEKIREGFETLIPELKESEDERIRKEIIDFLETIPASELKRIPRPINEWFAWLEKQKESHIPWYDYQKSKEAGYTIVPNEEYEQLIKQKEQKPAECRCTNDESEYDNGYREGHKFGLKQTQGYMLSGGKTFSGLIPCWVNAPSELQPAHKYHGKNVVVMHENNGGFRCVCIDDEKPVTFHLPEDTLFVEGWRKKPAEWSEDDSTKIGTLSGIIFDYAFYKDALDENNDLTGEYAELDNWLESLPERFNLQSKQEWSEEDEERIQSILFSIGYCKDEYPNKKDYSKDIDWLKSLRPSKDCLSCAQHLEGYISGRGDAENKLLEQFGAVVTPEDELHIKPRWKPSEEQMGALNTVLEHEAERVGSSKELEKANALYEQIKKLM